MKFKELIKEKYHIVVLLMIIIVASLPAFRTGVCQGHDLPFHLGRIEAIAEELQMGHIPVRYETSAWHGHGYISTTMYGNIFLYVPALLLICGIPLWRVYNIYIIVVNVATVAVAYYCFSKLFKTRNGALMAVMIYTFAGYRLSNLYVRAAVGEYTAMIFIPLVIYGIYRIYEESDMGICRKVCPLVVGASGLIQSHILTTELVAIFSLIYLLINFKSTMSHIKEWLIAVVLIVLINLFFILPFIYTYISMRLYANTQLTSQSIRPDGLYLCQMFGPLTEGFGSSFEWSAEGEGYLNSGIQYVLAFITTIVFAIANRNNKANDKKTPLVFWILFIFGIGAMFLSTVYFPWNLFAGENNKLSFLSAIQYPWRNMLIATVCFVITGVYGFERLISNKKSIVALAVVAAVTLMTTAYFDYTLVYKNKTLVNEKADSTWADKLYLPEGTERQFLNVTVPIYADDKVIIPTLAYDIITVTDIEDKPIPWETGYNGCIVVNREDFTRGYKIHFMVPFIWHVSEIISLITIIGLVIAVVRKMKRLAINEVVD